MRRTWDFLLSSFFSSYSWVTLYIQSLHSFAVYEGKSFHTFHLQLNLATFQLQPQQPCCLQLLQQLCAKPTSTATTTVIAKIAISPLPSLPFIAPKSVPAEASLSLTHGKREEGLDTASVTIVQFFFFSTRLLGFAHTWEQHFPVCLPGCRWWSQAGSTHSIPYSPAPGREFDLNSDISVMAHTLREGSYEE